jgi:hypothetical protein
MLRIYLAGRKGHKYKKRWDALFISVLFTRFNIWNWKISSCPNGVGCAAITQTWELSKFCRLHRHLLHDDAMEYIKLTWEFFLYRYMNQGNSDSKKWNEEEEEEIWKDEFAFFKLATWVPCQ